MQAQPDAEALKFTGYQSKSLSSIQGCERGSIARAQRSARYWPRPGRPLHGRVALLPGNKRFIVRGSDALGTLPCNKRFIVRG
jgi:hypothetical protein